MKLDRDAKLLRIFLGELDKYKGVLLYEAIVREARKQGIAGATVFRGILAYGASSRIHAARALDLSLDLPIIVEIVDEQDKIDAFVTVVDPMIEEAGCGALITIEQADVIHYRPRKK